MRVKSLYAVRHPMAFTSAVVLTSARAPSHSITSPAVSPLLHNAASQGSGHAPYRLKGAIHVGGRSGPARHGAALNSPAMPGRRGEHGITAGQQPAPCLGSAGIIDRKSVV